MKGSRGVFLWLAKCAARFEGQEEMKGRYVCCSHHCLRRTGRVYEARVLRRVQKGKECGSDDVRVGILQRRGRSIGEGREATYRIVVVSSLEGEMFVDGLTSGFKYCFRGRLTELAPLGFCHISGQ